MTLLNLTLPTVVWEERGQGKGVGLALLGCVCGGGGKGVRFVGVA